MGEKLNVGFNQSLGKVDWFTMDFKKYFLNFNIFFLFFYEMFYFGAILKLTSLFFAEYKGRKSEDFSDVQSIGCLGER